MSPDTPDVEQFCADGFLIVRGAVARNVVRACVEAIAAELRGHGVDVDDPATWREPVVRIPCPEGPAFAAAGTSSALWRAYDALRGQARWALERYGVGGAIPVRFPSARDPGDAGWHIDGSYDVDGAWWVNVHSRRPRARSRCSFSPTSAMTTRPRRSSCGSHLDVPRVLAPVRRDAGCSPATWPPRLRRGDLRAAARRGPPGSAGDVYVCHPFLVHRATWPHRGARPRIIAQPEIAHRQPFALRDGPGVCAVERAILRGLAEPRPAPESRGRGASPRAASR